jgi:uncharacterized membrane protein YfcA
MDILTAILFLSVAFFYASVGHGGASGYLALMALLSFAPVTMRPTALLLNVAVSLVAFIQYFRKGHFLYDLFWPLALGSIPAAFLGGLVTMDDVVYKKLLGVLLLLPVVRLAGFKMLSPAGKEEINFGTAVLLGASIGFVSGMIGIGGGILLSPLILLIKWADIRQAAAVSALFIFVNSLAGFGGLLIGGFEYDARITYLLLLALIGGTAGSYLGSHRFNTVTLNRLLATVLLIASIKLILT